MKLTLFKYKYNFCCIILYETQAIAKHNQGEMAVLALQKMQT